MQDAAEREDDGILRRCPMPSAVCLAVRHSLAQLASHSAAQPVHPSPREKATVQAGAVQGYGSQAWVIKMLAARSMHQALPIGWVISDGAPLPDETQQGCNSLRVR